MRDPAVASIGSAIGAGGATTTLNHGPCIHRAETAQSARRQRGPGHRRLQTELARIQGITLYMQAAQDITIGARLSKTQYQYTLDDADAVRTRHWSDSSLKRSKRSRDNRRRQRPTQCRTLLNVTVNRDVASSYGILPSTIDNTLDDAFGQRIVSTMLPR